jgi:hypothetical protein
MNPANKINQSSAARLGKPSSPQYVNEYDTNGYNYQPPS